MRRSSPSPYRNAYFRTMQAFAYVIIMLMFISCASNSSQEAQQRSPSPDFAERDPEPPEATDPAEPDREEPPADTEDTEKTEESGEESLEDGNDSIEELDEEILLEMVGEFVDDVHERIANGDYEGWRERLTEDYVAHFSDEEVLETLSDSPVLRRNNVSLDGLRDYFEHVVRASRTDVEVEEVEVRGSDTALAISEVDGEPVVLFNLIRDDRDWKIDRY